MIRAYKCKVCGFVFQGKIEGVYWQCPMCTNIIEVL